MRDGTGIPSVGMFQWTTRDGIGGYESTKDAAIRRALDECVDDAKRGYSSRFSNMTEWSVGVVVRIDTLHVEHGWQGKPSVRTIVVTSTVALGGASYGDVPITEPVYEIAVAAKGATVAVRRIAQGMARR